MVQLKFIPTQNASFGCATPNWLSCNSQRSLGEALDENQYIWIQYTARHSMVNNAADIPAAKHELRRSDLFNLFQYDGTSSIVVLLALRVMAQNKESNQKGHSFDVRRSRRHRPAYTRERAAAMFLGSIV